MLYVEPAGQHGAVVTETATKWSPAPLRKHSQGGCTIDAFPWNCHRRVYYRFAVRYLVRLSVFAAAIFKHAAACSVGNAVTSPVIIHPQCCNPQPAGQGRNQEFHLGGGINFN